MNPLYLPFFLIAPGIAAAAARAPAFWRRILAVLSGSFVGYGTAKAVNAVMLSVMSWHQLNGASVYTGDIETGLTIAGGGLGLLVSLFIRDATTNRIHHNSSEPEAEVLGLPG